MPIKTLGCSFAYRAQIPVLNALSLAFDSGTTVLLGPNGAGKSTLLSLAASALRPDSGSVALGPLDTTRRADLKEYRRRVGWLPQQVRPVPSLRVREQVAHAGWLKGMSRRAAWDASAGALERVALTELAQRRSSELSGGQLRRLGIAQALVHSADVLLMDEPTAGLDPLQRRVFKELVTSIASTSNTDVIVSTHQTEDLANTYDHVVVLDAGEVRHQGSVASFFGLAPAGTAPEHRAETAYAGLITAEV
ncbi:ATP-binding cassette domain-containing protein [Streptomyces sp. NA04227]|uniref:ATP-binding cassette domain-containing protein n=1 Tax=Streptomyces sp. NA04227 TaxID=2742136 RepID=UPI0015906915|nr:ATP-binding cassette domain-containing protein [Streptomyces sp. NA04227]QKW07274.1 ATP-binding cassette domain-containing protein [Streptomyces sp. NA04227]